MTSTPGTTCYLLLMPVDQAPAGELQQAVRKQRICSALRDSRHDSRPPDAHLNRVFDLAQLLGWMLLLVGYVVLFILEM